MQVIKENKFFAILFAIALFIVLIYSGTQKSQSATNIDKNRKQKKSYFKYSDKQLSSLDSLFSKLYKNNTFNGVVLVGQKDSVFYKRSFGYKNKNLKNALNTNSIFQLASVSKQFTAVAILQLYQQGLISLNDTIQQFIPNFPYKNITIHQLLTHRSGLPNYHYFYQHIPTFQDTLITNNQLIAEIESKKPAVYYQPNRRYHYSNTGYAILASIVERVAKCSFTEYLHKNIFEPLNMQQSYTYLSANRLNDTNITTGYLKNRKPAEDNYLDGVLGDKGVYSSVLDLFKWDQGLYKNTIIADSVLQLAFKPMGKPLNFKSNYGYGWRMFYNADSVKVLFHAGWWHGYKSLLIRIPTDTTSIIVLKNESGGTPISSKKILDILYKKKDTEQIKFYL